MSRCLAPMLAFLISIMVRCPSQPAYPSYVGNTTPDLANYSSKIFEAGALLLVEMQAPTPRCHRPVYVAQCHLEVFGIVQAPLVVRLADLSQEFLDQAPYVVIVEGRLFLARQTMGQLEHVDALVAVVRPRYSARSKAHLFRTPSPGAVGGLPVSRLCHLEASPVA